MSGRNLGEKTERVLPMSAESAAAEFESFYGQQGGEIRLPKLERVTTQSNLIQFTLTATDSEAGKALIEFKPINGESCKLYINTNESDTWATRFDNKSSAHAGFPWIFGGHISPANQKFCDDFVAHIQGLRSESDDERDNNLTLPITIHNFVLWATPDQLTSQMRAFEGDYPFRLGKNHWLILKSRLLESALAFEGFVDTFPVARDEAVSIGDVLRIQWIEKSLDWASSTGVKVSVEINESWPPLVKDRVSDDELTALEQSIKERIGEFVYQLQQSFQVVSNPFMSKKSLVIPADNTAAEIVTNLSEILDLEYVGNIHALTIPLSINDIEGLWLALIGQQSAQRLNRTILTISESYIAFQIFSDVMKYGEVLLTKRGPQETEMRLTVPPYESEALRVALSYQREILKAFFHSLVLNLKNAFSLSNTGETGSSVPTADTSTHSQNKSETEKTEAHEQILSENESQISYPTNGAAVREKMRRRGRSEAKQKEREERKANANRLREKGRTIEEIAELLHVSVATVKRDLGLIK